MSNLHADTDEFLGSSAHQLSVFEPVSVKEVEDVIMHLPNKTCALDHMPTCSPG